LLERAKVFPAPSCLPRGRARARVFFGVVSGAWIAFRSARGALRPGRSATPVKAKDSTSGARFMNLGFSSCEARPRSTSGVTVMWRATDVTLGAWDTRA